MVRRYAPTRSMDGWSRTPARVAATKASSGNGSHAQKSSWWRDANGTKSPIRVTRCSSRRPRRTVPSWDREPIGWPEPPLIDSTPAISVVATAPSPTQSTASLPSAGAIEGGLGSELCGACSLDDIGYTPISQGLELWTLEPAGPPVQFSTQGSDGTGSPDGPTGRRDLLRRLCSTGRYKVLKKWWALMT